MIVACVLRGDWPEGARYVENLQSGARRHLGAPHRFVVLTDHGPSWFPVDRRPAVPAGVEWVIALKQSWPRWWPKIAAFEPGLFPTGELVLLVDLDTAFVGSVTAWADYAGEFAILADLLRPKQMIGSGLVLFRAGGPTASRVWEDFTRNPEGHMSRNRVRMDYYLYEHVKGADRIQDLFPGQVVSYKGDCRCKRSRARVTIPEGTRVVCFHGQPRPHEVPEDDPVRRAWEQP